MKKVFALAFALAVAAPALTMAQNATPATPSITDPAAQKMAPAMEKKSGAVMTPDEAKFEFGNVKQGEIVEHVFSFRNTGTEPLVISNVGVSCGCTTPEYTKDPVLPGKAGKITARFNTAGKMGQQNKTLTVNSNNGGGDVYLTLSGTITEGAAPMTAAPASTTEAKATPMTETKATPVEKGKIKIKKDNGQKEKVKISDGKAEAKK